MSDHHGSYVALLYGTPPAPQIIKGKWEVDFDEDRVMVRVRWSLPCEDGAMFYCRHYPAEGWGINACERTVREWNESRRDARDVRISNYVSKVPLELPVDEFNRRMAIFIAHNAKNK